MRRIACGVLMLVGCSSDTGGDVRGPFTGDVHVYDVDSITLPSTTTLQNEYAGDLDGDGATENQLGLIVAALTQTNDTNKHVADIVASGSLGSTVEIHADDLMNDATVGVRYLGEANAGGDETGGKLAHGEILTNRTATTKLAVAMKVRLPVFADADPLTVPLIGVELDLESDGNGGFDGVVRGGIPIAMARTIAYAGVMQMMRTNPSSHLVFARLLDTNKDGDISQPELEASALLAGFIVDDIEIQGEGVLSAAFAVHLCPEGACVSTVMNACTDRIKDGMETDVDCGGPTCPTCAPDMTCSLPSDCQSNACDAGKCRDATCSDGARDGFESDVDCGAACRKCDTGKKCANADDCASGHCVQNVGSSGTCAAS